MFLFGNIYSSHQKKVYKKFGGKHKIMKALLAKAIIIVATALTLFGLWTLNFATLRIGL